MSLEFPHALTNTSSSGKRPQGKRRAPRPTLLPVADNVLRIRLPMIIEHKLAVRLRGARVGDDRVESKPRSADGRPAAPLQLCRVRVVGVAEGDARNQKRLDAVVVCPIVLRRLAALVGEVDAGSICSQRARASGDLERWRTMYSANLRISPRWVQVPRRLHSPLRFETRSSKPW